MHYSNQKELNNAQYDALFVELEKLALEKEAMDPITWAGLAFAAKTVGTNVVLRHGHKLPGMRKAMGSFLGATMRAGAEGKPMLSRPTREVLNAFDHSTAVAYERAHALGKVLGPENVGKLHATAPALQKVVETLSPRLGKSTADLTATMAKVPHEPGPFGKFLDTMLMPASHVSSQGKMNSAIKALKEESKLVPKPDLKKVEQASQEFANSLFPELVKKSNVMSEKVAQAMGSSLLVVAPSNAGLPRLQKSRGPR